MLPANEMPSGTVTSLFLSAEFQEDPLKLFYQLTDEGKNKNTVLLESSEITNKKAQKSILVLKSALRIECQEQQIVVKALTENGRNALDSLTELKIIAGTGTDTLILPIPAQDMQQDEFQRLTSPNAIDVLRVIKESFQMANENEFSIFLAGLFSYDFIETFEPLPEAKSDTCDCPNFVFYLAETLVLVDHQSYQLKIVGNVFGGTESDKIYFDKSRELAALKAKISQPDNNFERKKATRELKVNVDVSDDQYANNVETLKQRIVEGDIFQIVPSRTFSISCFNPFGSYLKLRELNPSPYMFFLNDVDFQLFGASPESAVKYSAQTREVEVYPIAGTRPRGLTPDGRLNLDLDTRIEAELRTDEKEITEHMMLVDLARNDIARISKPGSRHVKDLLKVDRYSHVMHLVSRVAGTLKDELDAFHAYLACMNMGTLVGAPKIKAAQILRTIEGKRRGAYGGAVGYITADGSMDSCIVIRSAVVKNETAFIKAGAGVVYDSVPISETDETSNKARAVIKAICLAHEESDDE